MISSYLYANTVILLPEKMHWELYHPPIPLPKKWLLISTRDNQKRDETKRLKMIRIYDEFDNINELR